MNTDKVDIKTTTAKRLFNKEKCLQIKDISRILEYSDRSVQRLLKKLGYYSSFTDNGKWYTLEYIPEFDVNGLWFYQGIGFSKWRNLTATILKLVENSVNPTFCERFPNTPVTPVFHFN